MLRTTLKTILQIAGGLIAGGLLVLLLLPLLPEPEVPTPPAALAVAENGGPLEAVALHYSIDAADLVMPTYAELLRVLPTDTAVYVAVPDAAHFADLQERLAAENVRRPLTPVLTGRPITPWSRDRYTLARTEDRWLLVVPQASDGAGRMRLNDWLVPWDLAAAVAQTEVVTLPIRFDAGDLLVTTTHVLASYRLLEKNLGALVASEAQLVDILTEAFGLPVLLFGDRPGQVPSHHLGMYLTALPDGRVLVGDARLGLPYLDAAQRATLDVDSGRIQAQLDEVAGALGAAGLEVVRIPIVPLTGELDYLTYNNALVESRDGRTIAYVPVYGFDALDAAGLAAWRELGVEVHPIPAAAVYREHGSLHCLVNVLRRGPAQLDALASGHARD